LDFEDFLVFDKGEKEKEKENQKQKPESPVHQSVEQAAKERMPENPVMCQHCDSSLKRLAKKSCLNCCSSYCGRCFRRSLWHSILLHFLQQDCEQSEQYNVNFSL
jgi:hypothetical protein